MDSQPQKPFPVEVLMVGSENLDGLEQDFKEKLLAHSILRAAGGMVLGVIRRFLIVPLRDEEAEAPLIIMECSTEGFRVVDRIEGDDPRFQDIANKVASGQLAPQGEFRNAGTESEH